MSERPNGGSDPDREPSPGPERIVVATGNSGKLREFRAILVGRGLTLEGLDCFPPVRFPEEGEDYTENAVAKARTAAQALGCHALADDSGLEVEALNGAPGPLSARFGGPGLDDAGRSAQLLARLEGVPVAERGARFVCVAAWASPDGVVVTARGECVGRILEAARGSDGFGYDPIFEVEGEGLSMAELGEGRKNRISHRALALQRLFETL